jgi:hypothetical protein
VRRNPRREIERIEEERGVCKEKEEMVAVEM